MLLQCFEKTLIDHHPKPPHHAHTHTPHIHSYTYTFTHIYALGQSLEIPHIPSTSLTASQPRRDNKGMGRH